MYLFLLQLFGVLYFRKHCFFPSSRAPHGFMDLLHVKLKKHLAFGPMTTHTNNKVRSDLLYL